MPLALNRDQRIMSFEFGLGNDLHCHILVLTIDNAVLRQKVIRVHKRIFENCPKNLEKKLGWKTRGKQ